MMMMTIESRPLSLVCFSELGAIVGVLVMATVVVPDTPVTSSHFEVEVAAALISAIRVELSDSTEVKVELTVLSRSDASEKVVSASETCTVNETVAAVPSSARRRVLASVTLTPVMSEAPTPPMTAARPLLMAEMSLSVTALASRPSMVMVADTLTVSVVVGVAVVVATYGARVGLLVGLLVGGASHWHMASDVPSATKEKLHPAWNSTAQSSSCSSHASTQRKPSEAQKVSQVSWVSSMLVTRPLHGPQTTLPSRSAQELGSQ
mmetsp:Transcript_64211/g.177584  ORF Transcript_64211/g.177584 Transcript_64211/m.177584 type:complete len:264 (-) Transcript_64211:386-1177(-)